MRDEHDPASGDAAVDEAYNYAGSTWRFYNKVFGRNSLDDQGMTLVQSVHAGVGYDNAFWDGRQMVYGDGDGVIFTRFTKSVDVVGHELTHGVVSFTSGLEYYAESGALQRAFADVFGSLVKQYRRRQTAKSADWLIGKEILVPKPTRTALRSMKAPGTAYLNDPDLGDDPQPSHYRDRYRGSSDSGGVHINSGIPNHAFYLGGDRRRRVRLERGRQGLVPGDAQPAAAKHVRRLRAAMPAGRTRDVPGAQPADDRRRSTRPGRRWGSRRAFARR